MGNSNQRIEIFYADKSDFLYMIHGNYDLLVKQICETLRIGESICLTLENNRNEFISSSYKFDSFIQPPITSIKVWDQVPKSLQLNKIAFKISKRIFKIIDKKHNKIHALGIKISKNLCLIPKTGVVIHDDLAQLCNEYYIELFNRKKGEFDQNGIFLLIGNRVPEQNFILCEITVKCKHLKVELFEEQSLVKGYAVYFNKVVKMLEAERFTHVNANADNYLQLRIESKSWLPGAFIISDNFKLLGIHLGNISKECISLHRIFSQISEIFEIIIYQPGEIALIGKLLQINGLKIKIEIINDLINYVSPLRIPNLPVKNIITEGLKI